MMDENMIYLSLTIERFGLLYFTMARPHISNHILYELKFYERYIIELQSSSMSVSRSSGTIASGYFSLI